MDPAVNFSNFVRYVVFFITLRIFLFRSCIRNVWHNLNVLVSFFWLSFQSWIVQTHNYDWDVISWSSHHRFQQKGLRGFSVPFFLLETRFMNFFYDFNSLLILNSVPKTVTCNYNKIMIFNFKTCDFWLTYYNFWTWLFCLKISESSGCRKSTRKHSQRAHNLIIISAVCLRDCCCLIDCSSCCNYSLLFIRIWRLMVFADLIKFLTILTCQNRSWISKICHITRCLVDESH